MNASSFRQNKIKSCHIRTKILLNNRKNIDIQNDLSQLKATEATEYSLWKAAKNLKQPPITNPSIQTEDGTWAKTKKQKAEVIAIYLAQVYESYPSELTEN